MSRESPPTRRALALLGAVVAQPGQALTLAELAKETGTSKATSLGILNELTEAGWLIRDPAAKTYRPGPTMLAAGTAAQRSFTSVEIARPRLNRLAADLGVPVTASAVIDRHVTVLARADSGGPPPPGFEVGARYPFAPPSGVMFVAWEDDRTVDDWLASQPLPPLDVDPHQLRDVVASCREHGYLVVGLADLTMGLYSLLGALPPGEATARLGELLRQTIPARVEPYITENIQPRKAYDVSLACAPVFARSGHMEFLLAILLMRSHVPGKELRRHIDALLRSAAAITADLT